MWVSFSLVYNLHLFSDSAYQYTVNCTAGENKFRVKLKAGKLKGGLDCPLVVIGLKSKRCLSSMVLSIQYAVGLVMAAQQVKRARPLIWMLNDVNLAFQSPCWNVQIAVCECVCMAPVSASVNVSMNGWIQPHCKLLKNKNRPPKPQTF